MSLLNVPNAAMLAMVIALMILFFRWGKDLWIVDSESSHVNAWKKILIYIGVHIGFVLVAAIIGMTISLLIANGSPGVTNWIFMLVVLFGGLWIRPQRFLPKKKIDENDITSTSERIVNDTQNH